MKKILLSLFTLFISFTSFAQTGADYNYTIGFRAFSLMQLPKILNQTNTQDYTKAFANGAMLKFNDNQISYRLSGSYLNDDIDVMESDNGTGKIQDYSIKMGFEKNFNYGIVQPYFATDLGYRSHEFDGIINSGNATKVTKHGFTLAPGFGLKLNVARQLTFYVEGSVEFFYFQNKYENTPPGSTDRIISKNYQSQFLLTPLSTGLQFHFGNNR